MQIVKRCRCSSFCTITEWHYCDLAHKLRRFHWIVSHFWSVVRSTKSLIQLHGTIGANSIQCDFNLCLVVHQSNVCQANIDQYNEQITFPPDWSLCLVRQKMRETWEHTCFNDIFIFVLTVSKLCRLIYGDPSEISTAGFFFRLLVWFSIRYSSNAPLTQMPATTRRSEYLQLPHITDMNWNARY